MEPFRVNRRWCPILFDSLCGCRLNYGAKLFKKRRMKLKKLLLTSAIVMLSLPAHAQELKPYIGLDLMRLNVDYNDNIGVAPGVALNGNTLLEDSLNGLNIHVGSRFHKNFAVELGYFRTQEEEKNIAAGTTIGPGVVAAANFQTSVQLQGLTLDGLGYLPLGQNGMFDLIGTAGISWTKGEAEIALPGGGSGSSDESELGWRVGGGGQFNFNEKFNVRGIVRYQTADFDGLADNAWVYSAGLNFNF